MLYNTPVPSYALFVILSVDILLLLLFIRFRCSAVWPHGLALRVLFMGQDVSGVFLTSARVLVRLFRSVDQTSHQGPCLPRKVPEAWYHICCVFVLYCSEMAWVK